MILTLLVALAANAEEPATPLRININGADAEQLCLLPGIGPKRAERIIDQRKRRPYTRITQLLRVRGIGRKTLRRLRPHIWIGPVAKKIDPPPILPEGDARRSAGSVESLEQQSPPPAQPADKAGASSPAG